MPSTRASRLRYVGRLLALALLIGILAAIDLWRSFQQTTTTAERSVAGLTGLLAEQTERTIQAIDFTLIGLRDALQVAHDLPTDDPGFRAAMLHRLQGLPYVRALYVVGPDGFITHDTDYPSTPHVSLADRPYFRAHLADPGLGLHIGQPLRSRSVGRWFVSFSRRIADGDGGFDGIVVAAAEPGYFKHFYEGISLGDDDLIALLLADGTLIARTPGHEATIGQSYADSPVRNLAVARGSGVTWTTSPIDGVRRLVGYRMVAGGSVIVLAGWSERRVYDSWAEHAAIVGGGSILVWVLAAGLALLWRQRRRRERLEQARLAQGQRLETMGRIAGGIAHDLGNTIKIARTAFSLLKPSLSAEKDVALVNDADRSLKSAFDIIDRLLAFARRQELSPQATDLGELVTGFAPILRQAVSPDVEIDLDIAGRHICLIDPIRLESALLNLVLNSKDALPDGGRILIEVGAAPPPRRGRRGQPADARPWAQVVVADTGTGMSREVQERALEPFFTTRPGGSGLGLSQVLGFAQQSAGEVRIESREGGGTKVRLLFPTTAEPMPPPGPGAGRG
jgi:signal transduction histidine kinase